MMHIMNSLPVCGPFVAESHESINYDVESTEVQKCGFGARNRMLGDGGQDGQLRLIS